MTDATADRLAERARAWAVEIERTAATASSLVGFGARAGSPVVLKIVRRENDEWRSGEILATFGGRGVVPVLAHEPGAVLLERLTPGEPLAQLVVSGCDEEATEILATLLGRMSPGEAPAWCPTVEQWGEGFARYLASADTQVPRALVEHAQKIHKELCVSQRNPGLLHGDLQHYNVLRDDARGWVAIDPKGVVGELEYELGAALRNPRAWPESFLSLAVVERRLAQFGAALGTDVDRARAWTFTQCVLAAIWDVEDAGALDRTDPALELAQLLEASGLLHEFWA